MGCNFTLGFEGVGEPRGLSDGGICNKGSATRILVAYYSSRLQPLDILKHGLTFYKHSDCYMVLNKKTVNVHDFHYKHLSFLQITLVKTAPSHCHWPSLHVTCVFLTLQENATMLLKIQIASARTLCTFVPL